MERTDIGGEAGWSVVTEAEQWAVSGGSMTLFMTRLWTGDGRIIMGLASLHKKQAKRTHKRFVKWARRDRRRNDARMTAQAWVPGED